MKVWKKILLVLAILVAGAAAYLILFVIVGVQTYLPHERIAIRAPYEFSDIPDGMIPMGETIHHPKPQSPKGHPGIDFGWDDGESHKVISSSYGVVSSIDLGASDPGHWDLVVTSGFYELRYKELQDYNRDFKKGSKVKTGDLIGYAGIFEGGDPNAGNKHNNWHWELASKAIIRDRWCPLTYLDSESRKSIDALWARQPLNQMKTQFPDICSGDYKDRVE